MAEASLLTLDNVAEGFEGAVVSPHHRAAPATVIDQGIDGLLQHPLFIAHNDFRGQDFLKTGQAIVAVDHPPVEIV